MASDAQVLTLAQWLSPAYPIGAFSYSHGLERAVESGDVRDADALRDWLGDVLVHGAGRSDAILLVAAYRAPDAAGLRALEAQARAFAPSAERLLETTAQGRAFAAVTGAVWPGTGMPELCYPVAVGHAAAQHDLPLRLTAAMFLHAMIANIVSAGIRLIPIGQTDGQRVQTALAPLCETVATEALIEDVADMTSSVFLADIASMKHETQATRLFRT